MEKIETRDGSYTFRNPDVDECYHSTTVGAIEEAEKKYVEPANLQEGQSVLDFCFGLGYNTLAALMKVRSLRVVGIEHDREILDQIQKNDVPDEYKERYEIIKDAAKSHYHYDGEVTIKLFLGDAMGALKHIKERFDVILFDPFSPKKNPELWTEEIFREVHKVSKKGAILTTYSCARSVRENLKNAGWTVHDGPVLGRKSPATVAVKESAGETE